MYRQTTTTTEYDEQGRATKVTVTEKEYANGGPVGPSDLPEGHQWYQPPFGGCPGIGISPGQMPKITSGGVSTGDTNSFLINLSADDIAYITNDEQVVRVTGE